MVCSHCGEAVEGIRGTGKVVKRGVVEMGMKMEVELLAAVMSTIH